MTRYTSDNLKIKAGMLADYPKGLAMGRHLYADHEDRVTMGSVVTPTTDWCDISDARTSADPVMTHILVATKQKISSSDANDVALTGTGGWYAYLKGYDANYNMVNELVALNGQTPVETTNAFIRVTEIICYAAGTSGVNEGDIYCYDTAETSVTAGVPQTDAGIRLKMLAEYGMSKAGMTVVPNERILMPVNMYFGLSAMSQKYGQLRGQFREYDYTLGVYRAWKTAFILPLSNVCVQFVWDVPPMVYSKMTDIRFQCKTSSASVNVFTMMQSVMAKGVTAQ